MANNPITVNLPKDLPENWNDTNYVSPGGTEVGLTSKHGYNYLMQQVNKAQQAAQEIGDAFTDLASLDPETGKVKANELPDMDYQTPTNKLPTGESLTLTDTVPFYSSSREQNERVTLQNLKDALGVQSPTIRAITNDSATVTCSKGATVLSGSGTTIFQIPENGTWVVTSTIGAFTRTVNVEVAGAIQYTADVRILRSIAITTPPTKTSYINGDVFDPTGLVVTATFEDNTTQVVTDECTYSPTSMVDGVTQVVYSLTIAGTLKTAVQSVTVDRQVIAAVPSQSGTLTYNGSSQSPTWSGYDAAKMTIAGTQSSTNAGTFNVTFTPGSRYKWADGTTAAKSVSWVINKAAGSSSLNKSSISLTMSQTSDTITVTRAGTGTVTAVSSNTNVATVSVSGTTVTVTGVANGSATITVSVAADTNYTAPTNKTCSVSVSFVDNTLNNNSWATIRSVSDAGQGSNYWAVGDTKDVVINGTVINTAFSSFTVKTYILGFNHNSGKEGGTRIHFQFGKVGTVSVALCPSNYNSTGSGFCMNTLNTNSGGWNGSYMRKTVLGNDGTPTSPTSSSLMASLPFDLRSAMKSVTKYSDNTGGGSNTAGYVTATTDYLFLLAEFEVQGARTYANSAEQSNQAQYSYYSAGNSKVKYKHNDTATTLYWWCRSVLSGDSYTFCIVGANGAAGTNNARYSSGLAPGFCI